MDIDVRSVGGQKYCEAIIKEGAWTIATPLLNRDEALDLAMRLLDAADDLLLTTDFQTS